jgi:hypothetical protein
MSYNTNSINNNTYGIENENEHRHQMVFYSRTQQGCHMMNFYICNDKTCEWWESEKDSECCDFQVTRFSTRVTCYECSRCRKTNQDQS